MASQSPIYVHEGRVYVRPSRIVDVMKDPEYKGDGNPVLLRKAEKFGTKMHEHIQDYLSGKEIKLANANEDMQSAWKSYLQWSGDRLPIVGTINGQPTIEQFIYAPSVGVAARYDFFDVRNGGYLTDWKWTAKLTKKHRIKLNAYWFIFDEWAKLIAHTTNMPIKIPHCLRLVRFDKNITNYQEELWEPREDWWRTFLHMKEAYMELYSEEIAQAITEGEADVSDNS